MDEILNVFRDIDNAYEFVGRLVIDQSIEMTANNYRFAYDNAYLRSRDACEISYSLPLTDRVFSERETAAFFSNLIPEGPRGEAIAHARHYHPSDYVRILRELKDETIGAVMLGTSARELEASASYEPLAFEKLVEFAHKPQQVALSMNLDARLSIAGAQEKIGLLHIGDDLKEGWFIPRGSAPSNVIVKACTGSFSAQTINEHWCMQTLRTVFGEDAAKTELLDIPDADPLLVVRRFDRHDGIGRIINGLQAPQRLHQEDMCQALGMLPWAKYEPTEGRYVERCAAVVDDVCNKPFEDKLLLMQSLIADYALGNADNHLKNRSILWDASWSERAIAPIYDVTCTVAYKSLSRTMGMSVASSREWKDATFADFVSTAGKIGIPRAFAETHLAEIAEEIDGVKDVVSFELKKAGYSTLSEIATKLSHLKTASKEERPASARKGAPHRSDDER